jgi:hypothetical protein
MTVKTCYSTKVRAHLYNRMRHLRHNVRWGEQINGVNYDCQLILIGNIESVVKMRKGYGQVVARYTIAVSKINRDQPFGHIVLRTKVKVSI